MVNFGGVYNRFEMNRKEIIVPVDTIEFNPNFVFLLASGPIGSSTQRALIQTNIVDIHNATSGAVRPDIGCNISWDDSEDVDGGGMGAYVWTRFELLKQMATNINASLGLSPANGCKWWVKLFHRNYGSTQTGASTPSVPVYMRLGSGTAYAGTTGGTGASENGEYEGTLGAGSGAGNRTRAAKMWVPTVAARFQAWLEAIGNAYNNEPTFAGLIINETSPLQALNNDITGMSVPGKLNTIRPTSDADIMYDYFQNFFGAVVAARPSLSKKELMISANNPVASIGGSPWTMYTMLPLNPSVLYTQHKVGNLVQDAYKCDTPEPKFSVKEICKNNQPYAVSHCSYASLVSPDIRRGKGVDGVEYHSVSSVNPGTGIPGNKNIVITKSSTDAGFPTLTAGTMWLGKSIVLLSDMNQSTQATITGTVSSYDANTGACTINATSATGTGARSNWSVGLPKELGKPNPLPPHTIDEIVTYAVTERSSNPTYPSPWNPVSNHKFEGSTHVFFQITFADATNTSEGPRNYREYVAYLKTTANRVKTTRPLLY